MTFEDYKKEHYSITCVGSIYYAIRDGLTECEFDSMDEVEDFIYDSCVEDLKSEYKYHCDFCNAHFNESDIEHRIEDQKFTAPYGSTIVIGGDVATVPVCPICKDDMV